MAHLLIHRGLAKQTILKRTLLKSFKHCHLKKIMELKLISIATKDHKFICFHDFNLKIAIFKKKESV